VTRQPPDDPTAVALRGFGPVGITAALIILLSGNIFVRGFPIAPGGALLVLLWAWRSRTPWREIGYARPRNWVWTVLAGVLFGSAFKILMKMIVMPLLGAPPTNQAYAFLIGNDALLPIAIWAMFVVGCRSCSDRVRGSRLESCSSPPCCLAPDTMWARELPVFNRRRCSVSFLARSSRAPARYGR
jgi:hypothetical protein